MPAAGSIVPAETDLLCEACGYTLNGLPRDGNCPECGTPISQSIGDHREPAAVERSPSLQTFVRTTAAVLLRPRVFYRTLATRFDSATAARFSQVHRVIAATLFGLAAGGHVLWGGASAGLNIPLAAVMLLILSCAALAYALLQTVSALAAWLSAIEARYWGMRLPHAIVKRGLQFHAACYLPVSLVACAIIWGHLLLLRNGAVDRSWATAYLYTLCGTVVASAGYLFWMYWIAMRSMMYANR
jgi:hypothetical protein